MKYVIEDLHEDRGGKNWYVIQLEIDYELMTLYDAIQAKEYIQVIRSKERLNQLRLKLLELKHDA